MAPVKRGATGAAVASANNVQNPTTLNPVLPAHQFGDLLLCATFCRATAPTVATPSGWTQLINIAGTICKIALFGKVAASASESNPSVVWSGLTTGTGGTPVQAQCAVFSNMLNLIASIVDILGAVENAAGSTTTVASGAPITTLTDEALVLSLAARPDDVGTWAAPSGFTLVGSALTTSGADMAFGWAYQIKTVKGSVAPADFGLSGGAVSQSSLGILIALKPTTHILGRLNIWNGSAWVEKPMKAWSGSAWVEKPVKVWNGSSWVPA